MSSHKIQQLWFASPRFTIFHLRWPLLVYGGFCLVVGTVVQLVFGAFLGKANLRARTEQIIHRAGVDKVDLLVLGRRGTSTFHKWILGSVSEKVLRYAHCPVMVLR